jgi:hypothetical protein
MIEEIFAVEKRKAVLSGPDSDGSDGRIAKKVAHYTQQTQFAVRGSAAAQAASSGGPSANRSPASGGPSANRESGGPSANRESASVGGPSTSILERPRAVAYSKTVERPVEMSGGQTKIVRKDPEPAGVIQSV